MRPMLSIQLVDDCSADEFSVFWPRKQDLRSPQKGRWTGETWLKASLNRQSGRVLLGRTGTDVWLKHAAETHGWLMLRNGRDLHERLADGPGTAMPYTCPNCGTDHSSRKKGSRLSPVRGFRPGFTKSTQLLASELFDILSLGKAADITMLISFSDSRQDAAKSSLDIERRNHDELWRV